MKRRVMAGFGGSSAAGGRGGALRGQGLEGLGSVVGGVLGR